MSVKINFAQKLETNIKRLSSYAYFKHKSFIFQNKIKCNYARIKSAQFITNQ